jgi:hypothetical protein
VTLPSYAFGREVVISLSRWPIEAVSHLSEAITKVKGEKMEIGLCFPTFTLCENSNGGVDQLSAFGKSCF